MSNCDLSFCSVNNSVRDCKCYPNLSILSQNPSQEELFGNQFCAFESEDGFLYSCDAGCCQGGCPGECSNVSPRPPEGIYVKQNQIIGSEERSTKVGQYIIAVLVVMFGLALATVASLFHRKKMA